MKQTQVNKSAIVLLCTILVLMTSSLFVISKFLPFLTHTFNYCETVVRSLAWQNPQGLSMFLFATAALLMGITFSKIMLVSVHAFQLKKSLISYTFSRQQELLLKELGIAKNIQVISDTSPQAFCFGIIQPKIYVSNFLLELVTIEELETILRHEMYHLKHNDTVIMFAIYLIQHFFPFFPLLSDLIRNYRIERELRADESAIQGRGESGSLVSVLKKLLQYERPSFAYAPALADEDTFEARIQALVHQKYTFRTFRLKHIIVSVLSISVLGTVFFIPVQASEVSPETNAVMVCFYSNDQHAAPHLNKSVPYSPAQ